MPNTPPRSSPQSAMRNVYQLYPTTASSTVRSVPRTSGSPNSPTISQVCGIARSLARGITCHPRISPPSSGPSAL